MALAVQCPGCRSRLGVLESAIGTKVECPKCHKMVKVPGGKDEEFEVVDEDIEVVDDDIEVVEEDDFEVVDDEPKKAPKKDKASSNGKPKKKARDVVADDDDDEDEDYDERPKKKKGKKKAPPPKSNMPLMIGVGALVLIVAVVGAVFAFKGGKGKDGSGGGAGGENWVKFDAPDGSFTAYFPGGSPTSANIDALSEGMKPEEIEAAKGLMQMMQIKFDAWKHSDSGKDFLIAVVVVPPQMANQMKPEELTKPIPKGRGGRGGGAMGGMPGLGDGEIIEDSNVSVSGLTAKQILVKDKSGKSGLLRVFFSGNKVVLIGLRSSGDMKSDDATAQTFFNKFEWKAKS